MNKVALFVDWENVRREIQHFQRKDANRGYATFDYNNVSHIVTLVNKAIDNEKERLYRIFFYTAEPLSLETIKNRANSGMRAQIDKYKESDSGQYEKMERLNHKISGIIKELALQDFFAVRLGELRLQGFSSELQPIIVQKQVDMLLGLDISHVAYQRLVDNIVVFSKDTDIIPALKCARINGLTVSIAHIKEGYKIPDKLRKHTDTIREISLVKEFHRDISNELDTETCSRF